MVSVSVLSFLSVSVLKKKEHLFNYKSLMKNIEIVFKINTNCTDPAIPSNFTRIREVIYFTTPWEDGRAILLFSILEMTVTNSISLYIQGTILPPDIK